MKTRTLLLLFSGLLAGLWFTACGGDDEPVTPAPPPQEEPKPEPEPEPEPEPPAPTDCQVSIAVDWSLFGDNPAAMTAVFYPADTTAAPITRVVQRADSVQATLTPGKYDVLLFNDSIARFTTIGFRGMDKFDTAELYLLPQKAVRSAGETPLIVTGELEPIGIAILKGYEVTEAMLTSAPDDSLKHLRFQPYTIDAVTSIRLEVNDIERVSSLFGTISGMAETYHISTGKTGASKVTHSLADWLIEADPDNPGGGWFRTHFASFGPPQLEEAWTKEDVQLSVSIQVEGVEQPVEQTFPVGNIFHAEEGGDTPGGSDTPGGDLEVDFHVEVDVPIVIPTPDDPDQPGEGGGEGEGGEDPDQPGEGGGEGEGGEDPDQPGEGGGEGEGGDDPDQPGGGGGSVVIPQPVLFTLTQDVWGGNATTLTGGSAGLFVRSNDSYTHTNIPLVYASGSWLASGLYQAETDAQVTYTVYTPYDASASTPADYTVSVPAAQTADNQSAADFRYASGTFAASTGSVALELQHQLAQLRITLTPGTEFGTSQTVTITKVTLSECALQRSFNLETGAWNALAADMEKETMALSGSGKTFVGLLVPQTLAGYTLTVVATIDGKEQTYTFTGTETLTLTEGMANTLSFTVGSDRLQLNKVTVNDWLPGNQIGDNENEAEEQ